MADCEGDHRNLPYLVYYLIWKVGPFSTLALPTTRAIYGLNLLHLWCVGLWVLALMARIAVNWPNLTLPFGSLGFYGLTLIMYHRAKLFSFLYMRNELCPFSTLLTSCRTAKQYCLELNRGCQNLGSSICLHLTMVHDGLWRWPPKPTLPCLLLDMEGWSFFHSCLADDSSHLWFKPLALMMYGAMSLGFKGEKCRQLA